MRESVVEITQDLITGEKIHIAPRCSDERVFGFSLLSKRCLTDGRYYEEIIMKKPLNNA